MIQDPKARTRGALTACILAVVAALSSLTSGACASHDAEAPDGPPPTLREALSPDHLARVALLDSQTPFPPTAGRAILLVDGDFYARAADTVRDYVRERLLEGVPVVFFGDRAGYEALRGSAGAAADLPAEPALEASDEEPGPSGTANPAAAARGLKIYPSRHPDELRRSAAIEVSGSPGNPAPLIGPVIQWAEDCAAEPE